MDQDSSQSSGARRLHVAIIMDGNGRWATRRNLPRAEGHRAGLRAVRRVVQAADELDVAILTLYTFSTDNWSRPPAEVSALMRCIQDFHCAEHEDFEARGIRVSVRGRRDRLPAPLVEAIESTEAVTAHCQGMNLRLAIDYSARDAIVDAARIFCQRGCRSRAEFSAILADSNPSGAAASEVDLLIRTGGEQRLSDFMLWECAYAELFFSARLWPDFAAEDLKVALQEFFRRERRFGRIAESAPANCPAEQPAFTV
ncbi:MAG TPA: polyprenyl diphosphate synthase [Terriglobia bacterium]|nr:polyprenyl diphosphate synthase [Terriglobia bacterium]